MVPVVRSSQGRDSLNPSYRLLGGTSIALLWLLTIPRCEVRALPFYVATGAFLRNALHGALRPAHRLSASQLAGPMRVPW